MLRRALLAGVVLLAALQAGAQERVKFMGRDVTVVDPGSDPPLDFPKGPASVCLEGFPRQCFTMPAKFGGHPNVEAVELTAGSPALLFSADSGWGSGTTIHFALVRPGPGWSLEDSFPNISISNESQRDFWDEPSISGAKIFVTADFEWGPDEPHYGMHRYIVSAYVRNGSSFADEDSYRLEDQYMTARWYDLETDDVLASEKQEILARLRAARDWRAIESRQ
jgi:hypothetical protein